MNKQNRSFLSLSSGIVATGAFALLHYPLLLAAIMGGMLGGTLFIGLKMFLPRSKIVTTPDNPVVHELLEEFTKRKELLRANMQKYKCAQGIQQIQDADVKFEHFVDMLLSKLDPDELTFSRFFTKVKELYLIVFDNLESVSDLYRSVAHLTSEDLEQTVLKQQQPLNAQEQERRELKSQQEDQARIILQSNEQLLLLIDKASIELAKVVTLKGEATLGLKQAIDQVETMIASFPKYSRKQEET
jgi:hypothetical protein